MCSLQYNPLGPSYREPIKELIWFPPRQTQPMFAVVVVLEARRLRVYLRDYSLYVSTIIKVHPNDSIYNQYKRTREC